MIRRAQTAEDIVQQIRNEVDDTLLIHAPDEWPDEELDDIEAKVLDQTRVALEALSAKEIQSPGTLDRHIAQAVTEAKRLIDARLITQTPS
jgi:hypothetical protein